MSGRVPLHLSAKLSFFLANWIFGWERLRDELETCLGTWNLARALLSREGWVELGNEYEKEESYTSEGTWLCCTRNFTRAPSSLMSQSILISYMFPVSCGGTCETVMRQTRAKWNYHYCCCHHFGLDTATRSRSHQEDCRRQWIAVMKSDKFQLNIIQNIILFIRVGFRALPRISFRLFLSFTSRTHCFNSALFAKLVKTKLRVKVPAPDVRPKELFYFYAVKSKRELSTLTRRFVEAFREN